MRKLIVVFTLSRGITIHVNVSVESPQDAWGAAYKQVVARFPALNGTMMGECRIYDGAYMKYEGEHFLTDIDLPHEVVG